MTSILKENIQESIKLGNDFDKKEFSTYLDLVILKQRKFFKEGKTRSIEFRKDNLKKLLDVMNLFEKQIYKALEADLRKSHVETQVGELGILKSEIKFAIKNLKKWMKPEKVKTPFFLFKAKTEIFSIPKGVIFVMGPWNYPFQLLIGPVISSIAAGNCIVIKPSELAPNSSKTIANLINNNFDPNFLLVIEGGVAESQVILTKKWDHICFIGGTAVGRLVMKAAAENLTPVTLELGGKSPCIVDKNINLKITAKRIIQGKFVNAGQNCLSPDYLFIHKDIKSVLLKQFEAVLKQFYKNNPETSLDYSRIINDTHFNRLSELMSLGGKIITGGKTNTKDRYIAPTLIDDVGINAKIMEEEIFGPLFPILTYENVEEVIDFINSRPHPLELYIFSTNKKFQNKILNNTQSGGAMVNDAILHWTSPHYPVGGIGNSGIGILHGKYGFDTFSHKRGVTKKQWLWFDPFFRYPPFTKLKIKLLKLTQK